LCVSILGSDPFSLPKKVWSALSTTEEQTKLYLISATKDGSQNQQNTA